MFESKCSRHVWITMPAQLCNRPPYECTLLVKTGSSKDGRWAPWPFKGITRRLFWKGSGYARTCKLFVVYRLYVIFSLRLIDVFLFCVLCHNTGSNELRRYSGMLGSVGTERHVVQNKCCSLYFNVLFLDFVSSLCFLHVWLTFGLLLIRFGGNCIYEIGKNIELCFLRPSLAN